MSYTVEWITPVYDRTYDDVQKILENPTLESSKGCYNVNDILRIENNTQYVMEDMLTRRIIRSEPEGFVTVHTWRTSDIVTKTDIQRIIGNVMVLMTLSNPEISSDLEPLSTSSQITYRVANAIEKNLETMKNQPELPVQRFWLEIEHGTIQELSGNSGWVTENDQVTIQGIPYGEYSEFMTFTGWSGSAEDLLCLANPRAQTTTLTMPFRNVRLVATFETHIPRTLTINSGHICLDGQVSEDGPSQITCYGGDRLLIVATVASQGKAFWNWTGTQAALDNLTGGDEPSSAWLVMPDMDVTLSANYINAGQHSVTVYQPTGTEIDWYDYDEYVLIFPADRGNKYTFSHWSGSTAYLEDINQAYESFKMPDINLTFTPQYTYNYSINTVRIIDGTIDGQTEISNARESSNHAISANIPLGMGFDYWSLEGVGSFADYKSANTTFYVGDGNAIVTAHFTNLRTLTIENQNNTGGSSSSTQTQNQSVNVSTETLVGDYIFTNWTEDNSIVSSSNYYQFTMPERDRVLRANYRLRNQVEITINYGNHSETVTMQERTSRSITADTAPEGQHFARWSYSNLYTIIDPYSSSTSITAGSTDGTVTAIFENDSPPLTYHNLTVNNGSGSGSVAEGYGRTINGNQAPETYEFDYWEINSGNGTIDNIYSQQTTYRMGTNDGEITAHYKLIPSFTVTVINGSGSGTFLRNSNPPIIMNPAPEGMQFFQWEVLIGDTNAVYQPLAENTYIQNLTGDITVQATYYTPDPETPYTISMTHKDGSVETTQHFVGDSVTIYADSPDEGYEFRRWTGDTQYINNRYSSTAVVNMPARNIQLGMQYKQEGATELFHVVLLNGELLVSTEEDPETHEMVETWSDNGEFEEGSVVPIRAVNIPFGYSFYRWWNPDDNGQSMSTVAQLQNPETTLTVSDFDITLERAISENDKYNLTLLGGGQRPGRYYENQEVPLYFPDLNTETIHYIWKRWSGTDINWAIANLKVKTTTGTKAFDPFDDGDAGDDPQVIIMPARHLELEATFSREYRLNLVNANSDGQSQIFVEPGTEVEVTVNTPPTGKVFWKWSGDTDYIVGNSLYNPTITVEMPGSAINLTALYEDASDPTDIGYTSESLYNATQVNVSGITVISGPSGTVNFGFILTDIKGHIFMVSQVENGVATIIRLTQKQSGGDV